MVYDVCFHASPEKHFSGEGEGSCKALMASIVMEAKENLMFKAIWYNELGQLFVQSVVFSHPVQNPILYFELFPVSEELTDAGRFSCSLASGSFPFSLHIEQDCTYRLVLPLNAQKLALRNNSGRVFIRQLWQW